MYPGQHDVGALAAQREPVLEQDLHSFQPGIGQVAGQDRERAAPRGGLTVTHGRSLVDQVLPKRRELQVDHGGLPQ